MNSPSCGLRVASVILGLICLGHLLRVISPFQVMLGTVSIPVWVSGIVFIVSGALSFWLWRLAHVVAAPTTPAPASGGSTIPPGTPATHA